jgi:cytochrome P450
VGGQHIEAGDRLVLSWSSANFDESVFDRPDEVILDRFPNRHQAFGLGIHRCLGSNLARAEFAVVLEEVLRRLPDYVIDAERARHYPTIGIVNGWITLPATFTAGPRAGAGVLT